MMLICFPQIKDLIRPRCFSLKFTFRKTCFRLFFFSRGKSTVEIGQSWEVSLTVLSLLPLILRLDPVLRLVVSIIPTCIVQNLLLHM